MGGRLPRGDDRGSGLEALRGSWWTQAEGSLQGGAEELDQMLQVLRSQGVGVGGWGRGWGGGGGQQLWLIRAEPSG